MDFLDNPFGGPPRAAGPAHGTGALPDEDLLMSFATPPPAKQPKLSEHTTPTHPEDKLGQAYDIIEEQDQELTSIRDQLAFMKDQYERYQLVVKEKEADLQAERNTKHRLASENDRLKLQMQEMEISHSSIMAIKERELQFEKSKVEAFQLRPPSAPSTPVRQAPSSDNSAEAVRKLTSEVELLKRERDYYKGEAEAARLQTSETRAQLDGQLQLALRAKQQLQENINSLKQEFKKRNFEVMDSASSIDSLKLRIQQLEADCTHYRIAAESAKDSDLVTQKLKADASKSIVLEKELAAAKVELGSARRQIQQNDMLKEQLASSKRQIEQLERSLRDFSRTKVELEETAKRNQEWEGIVGKLRLEFGGVDDVKGLIADMQSQNAILTSNNGTLNAELSRHQRIVEAKDEELKVADERIAELKGRIDTLDSTNRYQAGKLLMATQEVKGMKTILDMYGNAQTELGATVNVDEQRTAHIKELEGQLEAKAKQITELEATVEGLKKEVLQASRFNQRLLQEQSQLQQRIGRGEYNTSSVKILHPRVTPEELRQQAQQSASFGAVQEENQRLKGELDLLRSSLAASTNGQSTLLVEASRIGAMKLELLEAQQLSAQATARLQEKEKLFERYQQIFKTQLTQFKEVCTMLFGFRIDLDQATGKLYRVQSVYNRAANDFLIFEYRHNRLSLYENEYSTRIDPSISRYITQLNCIPGLLSAMTLSAIHSQAPAGAAGVNG